MHRPRRILAAVAAAAVLSVGAAVPAAAASPVHTVPDEHPWSTEAGTARPTLDPQGRGFVFGKNGELHLPLGNPADLTSFPLLSDMTELGYEVIESTGWAPTFQFIVANPTTQVTYARLVWEPYQQSPSQGPNAGTFRGLENGAWWHANVFRGSNLGTVPQNQTPRPFADFTTAGKVVDQNKADVFGPDTRVLAVSIRQGSTTDATAIVPWVAFNDATHSFQPSGTPRPGQATVEGEWTPATAPATERHIEQSREIKTFDHEIDFATWTWVRAATPTLVRTETRTVENPAWVDSTTPQVPSEPAPPARQPVAPPVADLTPELRSGTLVPSGQQVTAGSEVSLYVGRDLAGTWVDVFLFSDPVFLGRFLVAADGTVTAPVPATLAGDHRLVVADAETGEVVAWTNVAVAAAGAPTGPATNAVPRGATGWDEGGVNVALAAVAALAVLAAVPAGTLAVRRIRA
jgi:hypothetical protein